MCHGHCWLWRAVSDPYLGTQHSTVTLVLALPLGNFSILSFPTDANMLLMAETHAKLAWVTKGIFSCSSWEIQGQVTFFKHCGTQVPQWHQCILPLSFLGPALCALVSCLGRPSAQSKGGLW